MDSTNTELERSAGPVSIDWCSDAEQTLASSCPICDDRAAKRALLTANSRLVGTRPMVRCSECEALFFPKLPVWPYDAFPPEFVQLYIEQGASIDLMVQPLFRLPTSSVRRYLEVGCGFGFSVDFAAHALGWAATGLEPSQLGEAGRAALGIDVRHEYLNEQTSFAELHDLVFSSEVLEHVPEPKPFLRAAVRALAPGGVLMLTTPNAARLNQNASRFSQLSILSYPFHAILYTRATLTRVLVEAGLPFVHVFERDDTLIAMASAKPLEPVDGSLDRAHFRGYLEQRLRQLAPGTAAAAGFAYRSFKECVNAAEYAGAEVALERLRREVTSRFGFDLGQLAPDPVRGERVLVDVAKAQPFNLCGAYYFQGMLALNHWGDPERAARFFDAARRVGEEVRPLLWTIGVDDGEIEDLVLQATVHSKLAWARVQPAPPAPTAVAAAETPVQLVPEPTPPVAPEPEPAAEPELAAESAPTIVGYLDEVTALGVASGWAVDEAEPSRELTIELYVDGELANHIPADSFRADLATKGIGSGYNGFSCDLASSLVEDRAYMISARVEGVELTRPIRVRGRAAPGKQKSVEKHKSSATPVDAKSFLHVQPEAAAVARLARNSRRLAIVVHYHAQGRIFAYHRRLLKDLRSQGFTTVLVRNGSENLSTFVEAATGLADLVLVRDNAGLDFSAWISAFTLLGIEPAALTDLIFANDSVIGPLFPLSEALTQMAQAECDFWGMTDSWDHGYHLQSYFLCFKAKALESSAFGDYLSQYRHPTDKDEIIAEGEIGLTQALLTAGLRPLAYCPYTDVAKRWLLDLPRRVLDSKYAPEAAPSVALESALRSVLTRRTAHVATIASHVRSGQALNPSHFFWDTLISDFRLPFVKKDLLLKNPAGIPNVGDLQRLLETCTDFSYQDVLEVFLFNPGALAPPLPLVPEVPNPPAQAAVARDSSLRAVGDH